MEANAPLPIAMFVAQDKSMSLRIYLFTHVISHCYIAIVFVNLPALVTRHSSGGLCASGLQS